METLIEKQCSKCKNYFHATLEYFYKARNNKYGISSWCKKCSKEYYEKNKEKISQHKKIISKKYRLNNKDSIKKWVFENKESIKMARKYWRLKNKDKIRTNRRNYKAKIKNAEGKHTKEDVQKLLIEQDFKCKYCNCYIKEKYHVDHIVPLSKGGSNWPSNLCIACPSCNMKKHDKLLDEWLTVRKEA